MDVLRLFIAVDISDAQRAAVGELLRDLQKGAQFTKAHPAWVGPDAMHLTLHFLGGVDSARVPALVSGVETALAGAGGAGGVGAFDFALRGLGVFPHPHAPKVLWVGVKEGREALCDLAQRIESALVPWGYEPERRAFHPHLTLARIKSMSGAGALMDVIHGHRAAAPGVGRVDHVTLYRSELKPTGAVYTALHVWPLGPQ